MTRVDLTKAQCAELANYLRGVLNNGMGSGSFDKIEMLVLARRALAAAEELLVRMLNRERFPVAIWREVAAALDKMERKKGADTDGKDD